MRLLPSRPAALCFAAFAFGRLAAPCRGAFAPWFALLLMLGAAQAATGQSAGFAGVQTTVPASGLSNPLGVAITAEGNLLIADNGNNRVLKVTSAGIQTTIPIAGLNPPEYIAVDGSGDLYISDTQNTRVVEVTPAGVQTTVPAAGLSYVEGVAVDRAGDVFIADLGNNRVVEVTPGGQQTTVPASGLSGPYGVAVDGSGDVFITDTTKNRVVEVTPGGVQSIVPATGLDRPFGVAVDGLGDVYIVDTFNTRVVEVTPAGTQTTVPASGLGLEDRGVAVDGAGDVFVADSSNNRVVEVQTHSVNFGSGNVCPAGQTSPAPCTQTATLTYNITDAGTFGAPVALTQGTPGLDFKVASSTCTGTLSTGSQCTVTVSFAPTAPGARNGAVELVDGSGNVLATTLVYGEGVGPAIAFNSAAQITINTSASYPASVAADGAGNVFVLDGVAGSVLKVAPAGTTTTVVSGLNDPTGLFVDGAGNLFVGDSLNNRVLKVAPNGTQTTVGSGLNTPDGVAVDGAGNVFIADAANGRVVEVAAATGAQTTVGSGFFYPKDVAVDASGNVFVLDQSEVFELPAGGGAQQTVGSGLRQPSSLAVDGAGNIYVADSSNNRLIEFTAAGGPPLILATDLYIPDGVALDASGNLFVADSYNARTLELPRATPPSWSYADTQAGSTSTDSPMSFAIQDIGNQPLDVAYMLATSGGSFAQVPGSGTAADCSGGSAFTLTPGAACNLSISFTPQAPGPQTGTVSFADNSLNSTSGTQTVQLYGVATQTADNLTFSVPNQTYGAVPFPVQASSSSGSSGAITYKVDSGPATISGNILTLTGAGTVVVEADQAAYGPYAAGTQTTSFTVAKAATLTTLTGTVNNSNGTANLTARVAPTNAGSNPAPVTGSVSFYNGGVLLGQSPVVGGIATYATGNYTGSQSFTAVYTGDPNYLTSPSSTVALSFTVNPTITFATAANYAYGQSFQLMATSNSNGTFTYQLVSGPATVSTSGVVTVRGEGTVIVQANQAAATGYNAGSRQASFAAVQAGSTTKLTATAVKSGYGSAASLTAVVSPQYSGTPTGAVTFYDGSTKLATVALSGNTATYSTGQLSGAQHSYSAMYVGDANFTGSTSNTVALTIPVTAVSLQLASTKLVYPLTPAFEIVVAAANGKPAPTGTVTVYDGSTAIGNYPLLALTRGYLLGLVLPSLNVGTHPLSALYSGDANYAPGTSAIVTVTVTAGPVKLLLSCQNTSLKLGQTLACTVYADEGLLPVPGTVTYTIAGSSLGSVTLNKIGQAAIIYSTSQKGSFTLTAAYASQGNYQAAPPASVNFTVK
ncbi:Ig-like domain repeat protein [Acidipila sp. EB88]|uniref:Ig-like domain repeat protein n=1 Tax=Acidipila sp. EB88 TaxID=2305226 RepID=UPI000F5EE496|nr:Ig-like domain repeat protein [Acidipila sp. EB88]RRA48463.1 hypothetical protein D1Y84_09345 [Acidipila sp. EB88]